MGLHESIEEEWEKGFPEKEDLTLHRQLKKSVDEIVVKALPKDTIIEIDTAKEYSLGTSFPTLSQDEWKEMVNVTRVSYALSKKWIRGEFKDVQAMIKDIGQEEFKKVTNYIFHDTVQSVASIWYTAWRRFTEK